MSILISLLFSIPLVYTSTSIKWSVWIERNEKVNSLELILAKVYSTVLFIHFIFCSPTNSSFKFWNTRERTLYKLAEFPFYTVCVTNIKKMGANEELIYWMLPLCIFIFHCTLNFLSQIPLYFSTFLPFYNLKDWLDRWDCRQGRFINAYTESSNGARKSMDIKLKRNP